VGPVAQSALEREVKLDAAPGLALPNLAGVVAGVVVRSRPDQRLHAAYYDTEDLRLLRSGVTLRHRREARAASESGEWTLKLPEGGSRAVLARQELSWPGPPGPVPPDALRLVRAYRRTLPIEQVAVIVTHRRRLLLAGPGDEPLVEIDDDVVSAERAHRTGGFREIEVEVVGPSGDTVLDAVVDRLLGAGATRGDGYPKLARIRGPRAVDPPDVVPLPIAALRTMGDVVRAAVAAGYIRLVEHDPLVRSEADPEAVHQARVATRRLRSDLRTFRPLLPPDWYRSTTDELRWLGRSLGAVRDADVLLERLELATSDLDGADRTAAQQLLARLEKQRAGHRDSLLAAMDTDRYGELLDRLAAAARELPPGGDRKAQATRATTGAAAAPRRPWRRMRRSVRALGPHPTDQALHQVRIRAKRLRYASEAVAPVVGKPASALARAAADLQDVLGELHDSVVAEEWLRSEAGESPPDQALAAGLLIAAERAEAARHRAEWHAQWKKLHRKRLRAWIR
jgi:CHAD domain-containing protein